MAVGVPVGHLRSGLSGFGVVGECRVLPSVVVGSICGPRYVLLSQLQPFVEGGPICACGSFYHGLGMAWQLGELGMSRAPVMGGAASKSRRDLKPRAWLRAATG